MQILLQSRESPQHWWWRTQWAVPWCHQLLTACPQILLPCPSLLGQMFEFRRRFLQTSEYFSIHNLKCISTELCIFTKSKNLLHTFLSTRISSFSFVVAVMINNSSREEVQPITFMFWFSQSCYDETRTGLQAAGSVDHSFIHTFQLFKWWTNRILKNNNFRF